VSFKNNNKYIVQNEIKILQLQQQIDYLQQLKFNQEQERERVKQEQKQMKLDELYKIKKELLERVRHIELEMNEIEKE
jgi:hypothetical protein